MSASEYKGLFADNIDKTRMDSFESLLGTHQATFKKLGDYGDRLQGHIIVDIEKAYELMKKLEEDGYVQKVNFIYNDNSIKRRVKGD